MLTGNYSKAELREFVKQTLSGKVKTLEYYREFTREASQDIKKTTKYDSIREELQQELYHLDRQMASLKKMQKELEKVISSPTQRIQRGSLVITNKARFYISVSLGEIFFDGDRYYAISIESPMAQILLGKKKGEQFKLNNITQRIEEIY
ncbi:hypothetical protein [Chryseobacterium sp. A321]